MLVPIHGDGDTLVGAVCLLDPVASEGFDAEDLGSDLRKVTLVIANEGWLPTSITQKAQDQKLCRPIEVLLETTGDVLIGRKRTEMEHLAGWLDRRGTALGIGVVEVMSPRVEKAEDVAARIRTALAHVPAERVVVSTDCGLYQLPRDVAFRKLRALVEGTHIVRAELGG